MINEQVNDRENTGSDNQNDFENIKALVSFENVSKVFGKKTALSDINLNIAPGRIVGLLGPNGSGKTTAIKLMNGLIQSDSGKVLVNGIKPGIESKKIISYLPDKNYLNDWMSVEQLLNFFNKFYGDFDIKVAEEMIDNLEIDKKAKLKTLSKGTKEKVQLVLVMSRRASLYILDEPIGGVDPAARDYILSTIIKNYSEESSILISTHLIQEIERVLDDVIIIKQGEIYIQSSLDDIRMQQNKSVDELFREVFKC